MTEKQENFPAMTGYDEYLWCAAAHHKAYLQMGAHLAVQEAADGKTTTQEGTHFAVWAPNASSVSVIGDFNDWKPERNRLNFRPQTGVWQGFIPGVKEGALYKYAIRPNSSDTIMEKADPYATASELRPNTASKVCNINKYKWNDKEWLAARLKRDIRRSPMNIYELNLGSWKRKGENGSEWLTYRDLAAELIPYLKKMGYNFVEMMPITEFPYDGSWGYQTVGYFAPTSRYGSPEDFMFLVDEMHKNGIGVILDWVPAHFPKDGHGLARFDGTALYEHADPRQGEHPDWGTYIFNYGRNEVRNFLISSALFWLECYHIDGLRVDAVASMLYLDYGRQPGQWIPNKYGGHENLEAVDFLRDFNSAVAKEAPGCFTCAEESTSWAHVTGPVEEGGLGFTFKWNMGWMHDTLEYFKKDSIYRKWEHNKLTFGMIYQYSENFILPFSHDEVVYGKCSLRNKMPGDDWQKNAGLRAMLGYMMTYPGKKLLFMGGEFGQWKEWCDSMSLDWHLLDDPQFAGIQKWNQAINNFYLSNAALWELDNSPGGFRWIQCDDSERSVLSYLRFSLDRSEALMTICNFTPVPRDNYRVGVPWPGAWELQLNSDDTEFGGSEYQTEAVYEAEEQPWDNCDLSINVKVPPLSCIVLRGHKVMPEPEVMPNLPQGPENRSRIVLK